MPGVIHQVEIKLADLKLPRFMPCMAVTGPSCFCGASPTAEYIRFCQVPSHIGKVWLCPVHAMICASNLSICARCADRGGVSKVRVQRISPEVRT